jgi:hypothetical protein
VALSAAAHVRGISDASPTLAAASDCILREHYCDQGGIEVRERYMAHAGSAERIYEEA